MSQGEAGMINSVDHALRLVEALHATQPLSVSQLARHLHLPRPTIYRLLRTFGSHGLLVQEGTTYRLSLRLLELASTTLSASALQAAAQPVLGDLVARKGETAHFAVLDGTRVGYLAKVDSAHPIRMFSHVGWRGPLHATAVGKVLLAWSDPSLIERAVRAGQTTYTARTLTTAEELIAEIDQVRRDGYAVDRQELIEGLICVAAPVLAGSRLVGAVSVAGPADRFAHPEQFADDVRQAAAGIAARL